MTSGERTQRAKNEAPLVGRLVHATKTPGKLVRVDAVAARAAGAIVITGQHLLDLDPYIGPVVRDLPLLAIDRVRYTGEPVALVLAEDPAAAQAAASLVAYEVGPLTPAATGAPAGHPALVHLIEMLRTGPGARENLNHPNRSNTLITLVSKVEPVFRDAPDSLNVDKTLTQPPAAGSETIQANAAIEGSNIRIESASAIDTNNQLAQLFEPVGLSLTRASGRSVSPIAPVIDALTIAAARLTHRPVRLVADVGDFGWSGPRARLEINGMEASFAIDAGASAGEIPIWLNEIEAALQNRFFLARITVSIDYSESPPIAATLDDWREALAHI